MVYTFFNFNPNSSRLLSETVPGHHPRFDEKPKSFVEFDKRFTKSKSFWVLQKKKEVHGKGGVKFGIP